LGVISHRRWWEIFVRWEASWIFVFYEMLRLTFFELILKSSVLYGVKLLCLELHKRRIIFSSILCFFSNEILRLYRWHVLVLWYLCLLIYQLYLLHLHRRACLNRSHFFGVFWPRRCLSLFILGGLSCFINHVLSFLYTKLDARGLKCFSSCLSCSAAWHVLRKSWHIHRFAFNRLT